MMMDFPEHVGIFYDKTSQPPTHKRYFWEFAKDLIIDFLNDFWVGL